MRTFNLSVACVLLATPILLTNPIQVVRTTIKVNRALTKSLMTFTHPRRLCVATVVSMEAAAFTKVELIVPQIFSEGLTPARLWFLQQIGTDSLSRTSRTSNPQPGSTTPQRRGLWRCRRLGR